MASRPSGGSSTRLLDLCRMPSGNTSVGFVVSHRRKSLCAFFTWSESSSRSRDGSHAFSKWQFCRNTHVPFTTAVLIACSAFSSEPWPRDSSNMLISRSSFLLTMSERGSAPGLRIYKVGVSLSDILYISVMLGYAGLIYSGPILSTTNIDIPSFKRSIRKTLSTHIFCKMSKVCYPHGISASSGAGSSYHALHACSLSTNSFMKFLNLLSKVCSNSRSFQFASLIHDTVLFVLAGSKLVLPLSKKLNSPISILF